MGMYTELIFGAKLKEETPDEVIDALQYMLGESKTKPNNSSIPAYEWLLRSASYYFAINNPVSKMWFDAIDKTWHISTCSNIKNYGNEIETFLNWIKPFIEAGSGRRELYAIVLYEEDAEPTCYYLYDAV